MNHYTQDTVNIFFPDQEEPIYDPTDPISDYQFKEYWKRERDRCINGFHIADGQVYIPGELYNHCVYWKIAAYIDNPISGRKSRKIITPILRDIEWMIFKDVDTCRRDGKFYNLVGSRDFGKALINSATLYTTTGEIEIGNSKVGDQIYGADGKLTTITGVYPQGSIDIFKITLNDGRVLYCCDNHIWKVWNSRKKKYENLPLNIIRKDYLLPKKVSYKNRKGIEYKYAIPNNEAVEYNDNDTTPIDPYFLGLWLGDGDNRYIRITTVDREIKQYVEKYAGLNNLLVKDSGKYGYRITSGTVGTRKYRRNHVYTKFKDLQLIQNKHIPSAYFYTSIENRMNLLRGLMDTDGSCSKDGTVEFSTSNVKLAKDFYRLVRSLGIIATCKKRKSGYKKNGIYIQTKDSYRFTLLTDKLIFKLERKLKNIKSHRSERVSIVSIESYGKENATCITVDNKDQLFLTDNYTVTHNSIIAASLAGHNYSFFDNSESVISGGESSYIKLATNKIEDGLTNYHPVFKKNRISSDWKKEVRAGWKDKSSNQPSDKSSNSAIIVRNYEMGTKTMAANGTRPGFHLIDEIGTIPNLIGCVKDSDGCWWSGGGDKPSCLVMLAGTGGDMEVGQEAADIFYAPDVYNMLAFEDTWETGKKIGRFIPATMAKMAFKEPMRLSDYLGIDHPDLDKITILVSNEEKAFKEWWEPTHAKAKKGGAKTLTKFLAYWPLKPSDSFLIIQANNFNIHAARFQQSRLKENNITGSSVEIINDGEKLIHKFINKQPVSEFPIKSTERDGCVVMYEAPVMGAPRGLYVAGIDPYKQDQAKYSDSLGAVYIFKRIHDIKSEKYQDMIVAQYVGRPESMITWYETTRNLLKYYNAIALCENEDYGFIQYMLSKHEGHYLSDQPEWLKDVIPNSKVNRTKGIHANIKIINYINGLLKEYTEEVISTDRDESGVIIKEVIGMSKILDIMLLEEIIKFGEGNFDRIRAIALAIAMARHLDPIYKVSEENGDPRYKSYFEKNKNKPQLFKETRTPIRDKTRIKRLFK